MRVVNTGEPRPATATNTDAAPPLPPTNTAHLANAFDYVAHPNDEAALLLHHAKRPVAVRDTAPRQGRLPVRGRRA